MTSLEKCQLCDNIAFIKCNVDVIGQPLRKFTMILCKEHYWEAGKVLPLAELESLK